MKFNVETTITSPGLMAIMSDLLDHFFVEWLEFEKTSQSSFMIVIDSFDLDNLEGALQYDERVIKYSLVE